MGIEDRRKGLFINMDIIKQCYDLSRRNNKCG